MLEFVAGVAHVLAYAGLVLGALGAFIVFVVGVVMWSHWLFGRNRRPR